MLASFWQAPGGAAVPVSSVVEKEPLVPNNNISQAQAFSKFAGLAVPSTLARFIGVGSEFIGSILLARLGSEYLAASGLITILQNVILTNFGAALYATGDLASDVKGQKDGKVNVGKVLHCSYLLAVTLGGLSAGILSFSGSILKLLNQPPEDGT